MSELSPITKDDGWFTGEDQLIIWSVRARNGDEVNMSGWTIQYRMASTVTGTSILTKPGTIFNSDVEIDFDAADTTPIAAGTYHYTLARVDPGANQVLAHGKAILQGRVA